jgi:hypothetical protein
VLALGLLCGAPPYNALAFGTNAVAAVAVLCAFLEQRHR